MNQAQNKKLDQEHLLESESEGTLPNDGYPEINLNARFFFFSLDAKKILYSLGIFWPCLPYVNSNEQFIG